MTTPNFLRYARQIVLPEIGSAGQALLAKARLLVVGAGGLGSPALLYLSAAGVGLAQSGGQLGVIDGDTVDESNLQRQILFGEADQNAAKVEVAQKRLRDLNHATNLVTYPYRLNADNARTIMRDYDIVIDGSDNFATKYLLNDVAVQLGKPLVYGSILGWEGQVSVFLANAGPCYRCLYPRAVTTHIPNCAEAGTLGGIAGVVGSMLAIEACKLALGLEHCHAHGITPLIGELLIFDALTWDIRRLTLAKNPQCPVCTTTNWTNQANFSATDSTGLATEPTRAALISHEPTTICHQPATQKMKANNMENEQNTHQLETVKQIPATHSLPKTLSLADFYALQQSGVHVTLLDVRETWEWEQQHLAGAVHLPLGVLCSQPDAKDTVDTTGVVVVYCQHGIRSAHAVNYLQTQGINAVNLLVDWANLK